MSKPSCQGRKRIARNRNNGWNCTRKNDRPTSSPSGSSEPTQKIKPKVTKSVNCQGLESNAPLFAHIPCIWSLGAFSVWQREGWVRIGTLQRNSSPEYVWCAHCLPKHQFHQGIGRAATGPWICADLHSSMEACSLETMCPNQVGTIITSNTGWATWAHNSMVTPLSKVSRHFSLGHISTGMRTGRPSHQRSNTMNSSLSSLRPNFCTGSAISHKPSFGLDTANRQIWLHGDWLLASNFAEESESKRLMAAKAEINNEDVWSESREVRGKCHMVH